MQSETMRQASGPTLVAGPPPYPEVFARLRIVAELLAEAGQLGAGPVLVYRDPAGQVLTRSFGERLLAGRDAAGGLEIADEEVSRQHFQIDQAGETTVIRDLQSRNGTYVNGERIAPERVLRNGDIIQTGQHLFVFLTGLEP